MQLGWNEIKNRALAFSKEWATESREDAEAKSFWDAFFDIFGVTRRRLASFEVPVKKSDGAHGYIDMLWRGVLLVEHKSRGQDLTRATKQAFDYFPGLKERELPRYVLVSDFAHFRLYDLDAGTEHNFDLENLHRKVGLLGFIAGYQTRTGNSEKETAVSVRAAERLGLLHDQLKDSGYDGHDLEVLLVRILFCMFAEDTGIFKRRQFSDFIETRTEIDGSNLGPMLSHLFNVLNTPPEKHQANLDEQLADFPYVNGKLFGETARIPSFGTLMRETLLDCCSDDWSQISPAIFGSLFQSIMDTKARRSLGAHYTTEANIRKALRPLFLDELRADFNKVLLDRSTLRSSRLRALHGRLANVRVFDPACGCGNFLVVAYQELRQLELELLRELFKENPSGFLDVKSLVFVDVDQMYGIEIEEFPAQIAQVALWLTDHQLNLKVSEEFGQYFVRLPLTKTPHIINDNALTTDWASVVRPAELSFIVGNPPFRGKQYQTPEQRNQLQNVFAGLKGANLLDFVACWHRKAVDYMQDNPAIRAAFVSTNSITQGEQPGVLWPDLFRRGAKIHFAHRTFQWTSEGRGKAAVHCIVVGFGLTDPAEKVIYEYETPQSEPHGLKVRNINPYLVEGSDRALENRRHSISGACAISFGSMPNDGGHLLATAEERTKLLEEEPRAAAWLRPFVGSDELINGVDRSCLWLKGISPRELKLMPAVRKRVDEVRKARASSNREATRELAATPAIFGEDRQPNVAYIGIPKTSLERRRYIPIAVLDPKTIASTELFTLEGAGRYELGVLCSIMHMSWVRAVCGRMKSDYRYSSTIVYNNFPWPTPSDSQRVAVEAAAQGILDARLSFPDSTLAELYDPLLMPAELVAAHRALDRAVDKAYGRSGFRSEAERVAYLFEEYEQLAARLDSAGTTRRRRGRSKPTPTQEGEPGVIHSEPAA